MEAESSLTQGSLPEETGSSPYADPRYGEDAEHGEHLIHSSPRWSLEENQRPLTGYVGAGIVLLGGVLVACVTGPPQWSGAPPQSPGHNYAQELLNAIWSWRHVFLMCALFAGMFLVETLVCRTHCRHFDFESARRVDGAAWERIWVRWMALAFCVLAATAAYVLLGEYSFHEFDLKGVLFDGKRVAPERPGFQFDPDTEVKYHFYWRFILFFAAVAPLLLVFSVPYFWLVERHARPQGPVDEFLVLGRCLQRISRFFEGRFFDPAARADAWKALRNPHLPNFFKGLGVKFFFIPLMLIWTMSTWSNWEGQAQWFLYHQPPIVWSDPDNVALMLRRFHFTTMQMIILLDLSIALVGYIVSVRLLDTHVTSAEPTLLGWMAALLCYPPFNHRINSLYFPYVIDKQDPAAEVWVDQLAGHPFLSIAASLAILTLMAIYTWGTVAFGMRFSNLTNRGIVCHGPYRYIRHPAYICKNTAWWIEAMPFMASNWAEGLIKCVHLLAVNLIYFLRAYTEEWHLKREPHYQEYMKKVRWRFIPGVW